MISAILYRKQCSYVNGIYVKDMSKLGRDLKNIILVDVRKVPNNNLNLQNSPNSFLFQPENAFQIKNFFDDKSDRELEKLLPFLEFLAEVSAF